MAIFMWSVQIQNVLGFVLIQIWMILSNLKKKHNKIKTLKKYIKNKP
jgi:hypothetical protein